MSQPYSTDASKVSVHYCWPIGDYPSRCHKDSWEHSTVVVRSPILEDGVRLLRTTWHNNILRSPWPIGVDRQAPDITFDANPYAY